MIIEKYLSSSLLYIQLIYNLKKLKTHMYESYLLFMIMTRYLSIVASSQNITFKLFKK